MDGFTAPDPDFERRVRQSFALQPAMETLGGTMERVEPGLVEIRMPFSERLTQHNGYIHAGILSTILDSACGYAAFTLAPAGTNVLTVEYKANFMAPGRGEVFVATGRVLKAGRTLIVSQGEVTAHRAGADPVQLVAMLATIIVLHR